MGSASTLAGFRRPFVPFLGIVALAFAAAGLQPAGTQWWLVLVAGITAGCVVMLAAAIPWSVLPASSLLVFAICADVVIALLRQAQGGSTSGYGPLVILPVVWVGVTLGRRFIMAIACCTALLFALPIVIVGGPLYPSTGWRGVVLWVVVSVVIGLGVNRAVARHRRQADDSTRRAQALDQLVQAHATIATVDRNSALLMTRAAEGALDLTAADGACIELLEGDDVVCRAAAGVAVEFLGLRVKADQSITGECFRTRRVLTCTDSEHDSRVDSDACRMVGARSLILVPLLDGRDVKGVLLVWSATPHDFRSYESQLLALLANMLAGAITRTELIERLTEEAVTDELTGLANRRAWYHQLNQALARASRTGHRLSILILDLDGFKLVNDQHGHSAGDHLLKTISGLWTNALRTTDLLGRIGGDEFAVILELTDATAAHEVITRLERAIAGHHTASIRPVVGHSSISRRGRDRYLPTRWPGAQSTWHCTLPATGSGAGDPRRVPAEPQSGSPHSRGGGSQARRGARPPAVT
jgi:diguanylate cyclase (GGDEF)-like protein